MRSSFTDNGAVTNGPLPTATAIVSIIGDFGSGTMTIAVLDASGNAITLDTATADYAQEVTIGKGNRYRLTLSGATSPDLTADVLPVEG
jgi:hypothetical protein